MNAPGLPENEAERQAVVDELALVFTPQEERFDRITRIAKRLFDVPIALISIVSNDKQWFKSRQGLSAPQTSREISFCGHAILQEGPLIITNAANHPDFQDNPLVTGEPGIRFYAGQPIHFRDYRIGTLCLIDSRPRHLKPRDYDSLKSLAHWIEIELISWHGVRDTHLPVPAEEDMFEPLTGDLSEKGAEKLREALANNAQDAIELLIEIDTSGLMETSDDHDIRELASLVRSSVAGLGAVNFHPKKGFTILLPRSALDSSDELIRNLRKTLAESSLSDPLKSVDIMVARDAD